MRASRIAGQLIILGVGIALFFTVTRRFIVPVLLGFLIAIVSDPFYRRLL